MVAGSLATAFAAESGQPGLGHTAPAARRLFAHLAFVISLSVFLPACSTFHFGQTASPAATGHVQAVRAAVAERAQRLEPAERVQLADVLLAAEREHGLDPYLIIALIEHESGWRPDAIGVSGSVGLLQVQPQTGAAVARELGIKWSGMRTLLDPITNARLGVTYLATLHEQFGRRATLTLAAYNVGPGRLGELLQGGKAPRGVYSGAVLRRYEQIRPAASTRTAGL